MSETTGVSTSAGGGGSCGCPEALERLERFLDGELEEAQIVEISRHLAACYPCGDRAQFERHLREVVRTHAAEVAPAGLLDRVRERCLRELGDA